MSFKKVSKKLLVRMRQTTTTTTTTFLQICRPIFLTQIYRKVVCTRFAAAASRKSVRTKTVPRRHRQFIKIFRQWLWLRWFHTHLDKQTDCWPGLPAYTANLLHRLSTTKNGASYPPINTRQTGQKKLYWPGQILPPPSCFCCEWVTSATFYYTWTNSEAQTNQLSN